MSQNKTKQRISVYPTPKPSKLNPIKEKLTLSNQTTQNLILRNLSRWWVIGLIAFLSLGVLGAGLKYLDDSAREEKIKQQQNLLAKNDSLLARVNPFMPVPTPTPTPQLSKEYIYAGSRLLAVEDAAASAIPPADYDGDGKADVAVWRNSATTFYALKSSELLFQ